MSRGRRASALLVALFVVPLMGSLPACDRLSTKIGGFGPEAGLLRGKPPSGTRGATHVGRLTDGIAAAPGDAWRTDSTAVLSGGDAHVTWDLGRETPVRCALVDADGDDRYTISLSRDGVSFAPLWTAEPDEDAGQQLRPGRDLRGAGRYLRVSAAGGDGRWALSEVSAWSECPTTWPPLAMQKGTPDDEAVRAKLWAFAASALAYILLYRRRAPDWVKLLGVVPAGLAIALAIQVGELWPPTEALALRLGAVTGAILLALVLRRVIERGRGPAAPPPATS